MRKIYACGGGEKVKCSEHLASYRDSQHVNLFNRFNPGEGDIVLHPRAAYARGGKGQTFSQLCDNRAQELIETGKPITVCWSGGIDSTAIMAAFERTIKDRSQITVALTRESIRENERFYAHHILKRYATKSMTMIANELTAGGGENLVVDGELADQLFGADIMAMIDHLFGKDMLLSSDIHLYPRVARAVLSDVTMQDTLNMLREIHATARTIGRKIETIFDMFWLTNFCFKWQDVALRGAYLSDQSVSSMLSEADFDRNVHFFGTSAFQDWSLSGHEPKILDTWPSYKITAKRYIHSVDGDDDYLANKLKIPSLCKLDLHPGSIIYAPWSIEMAA